MKITIERVAILLLLLAFILVVTKPFSKRVFVEQDVKNYIIEDAKARYPNAEVVEILSLENKGDYYHAKVRVSYGLNTTCPTRIHVYYNYPEQNFVPEPPEYIVSNCSFSSSKIIFPEEAIVYSAKKLSSFIDTYSARPSVYFNNQTSIWEVVWRSSISDDYRTIRFDVNGNIIE